MRFVGRRGLVFLVCFLAGLSGRQLLGVEHALTKHRLQPSQVLSWHSPADTWRVRQIRFHFKFPHPTSGVDVYIDGAYRETLTSPFAKSGDYLYDLSSKDVKAKHVMLIPANTSRNVEISNAVVQVDDFPCYPRQDQDPETSRLLSYQTMMGASEEGLRHTFLNRTWIGQGAVFLWEADTRSGVIFDHGVVLYDRNTSYYLDDRVASVDPRIQEIYNRLSAVHARGARVGSWNLTLNKEYEYWPSALVDYLLRYLSSGHPDCRLLLGAPKAS